MIPDDSKVRTASISLKERQWKALDSFLEKGGRSDYFQRLVDSDLKTTPAGRYFSHLLGEQVTMPKVIEDRFEQRFTRLESQLSDLTQLVSSALKGDRFTRNTR